jgi:ABC-type branched-subunit amino acid transport system ATPase component
LQLDEPAAGFNDEESIDLYKVVNGIREDTEL